MLRIWLLLPTTNTILSLLLLLNTLSHPRQTQIVSAENPTNATDDTILHKQNSSSISNASQKSQSTQLVQHFPASRYRNHIDATDFGSRRRRRKQLTFVALLPNHEADNKNDCIKPKVLPVLELAIAHVQHMGFYNADIDITLISRDSFCSSIYGPIGFFEIYTYWPEINAIFGLPCDYVLAPISRYAGVWQIPVLTSGGNAADFDKKSESYPTLTRLKGAHMNNLGHVARAIIENFNWTRTALIYQNEDVKVKGNSVCFFCMFAVHNQLKKSSVFQQAFDTSRWKQSDIAKMLTNISKLTRIVIMCADPQSIRQIMLTAEELNMIDGGEYVFINIELFSRVPYITSQPWYDKNDTIANNERARKAYTAMMTVTPKQADDAEHKRISNEIKKIAASKYNYTFGENEPISAFVTSFYDGVLLYAKALNDSLREDPTVLTRPINGTDMVRRMWNRTFTGITGNVTIDSNGDRLSAFSLLDMNPTTGHFETVANFLHNRLEFVAGKAIHWAGNRVEPPPDTPKCGYDGSLCPDNALPGYAILSIVLGIVVLIMTLGFVFGYRHYKAEAEINSMTWKVSIDEVLCPDETNRCFRGSFLSLIKDSQQTLISEDMGSFSGDRQIFIPIGVYRGCKVAIKTINKNYVHLTRAMMLELKRMKDLQHDHLVKFYGACLDPEKSFLLTEYCPKGSLQDILENEQFQLDWMFKLSLMHDIVRGMQFLHNSDIKSHGNLKSSNCVVDSRFVLKITDFGLHSLKQSDYNREDEVDNYNSHAYWSRLLWTAPELLRMEMNRPPEGTQKGDVYSFGIIVHEITTRQGCFFLGDEVEKSPQEIIQLVKGYPLLTNTPFRPQVDNSGDTYDDINNMMTKCWAEDPTERPDFNAIKSTIRKINKDNETGNIVDNLLKRMEQYANNLEELVEERTQDYLEEKKKCEKLLYQLLPQSVAAQLISGKPVIAETFDQVTIYFSDIVGFTAISAESTPLQVVQFLNDLYTCFDSIVENFDVYKVETIGDAYMVVSGLPIRNGNLHAREIARLSLALLEAVHNFHIHHRPNDRLKLRIGLHTGPCVAGVVGLKMPRYCLFGDTVNTASRMESNGEALKIHISEKTKVALDEFGTFITTRRGYVPMKGKGEMLTYWLEGEVPKPDSPMIHHKLHLSRRSSLWHSQRHTLQKHNSDFSAFPPPAYQTQQSLEHEKPPPQNEPILQVKRKISSSSPKLNIGELKTDDFNFYIEALKANQKEKSTQHKIRDTLHEFHPTNSLRETNRASHDIRLPLSGTLKHHNNSSKGFCNQIIHSNSNSSLSCTQQLNHIMKLKTSPTISTLVACERARLDADNTSVHSSNRIKFNIVEETESNEQKEQEIKVNKRTQNNKLQLLHKNCNSNSSNLGANNLNFNNGCNNANNFNNIAKVNNNKSFNFLCKGTPNNLTDERHTLVNNSGGTAGNCAVTQPLLQTINT